MHDVSNFTKFRKPRILVGSTAGRGPCEDCGLIAELHQAREGARVLEVCHPCAQDARPRHAFAALDRRAA